MIQNQYLSFIREPFWWWFLFLTGFLTLAASGFIWIELSVLSTLTKEMFHLLCHQFSWRSISHDGQTMAVCSRCFGIYSGLFVGALFIPLLYSFTEKWYHYALYILGLGFALNFIDFLGNLLGIWANTLSSRLVLGLIFGTAVSILILSSFYKQKTNKKSWNLYRKNHLSMSR